MKKSNFSLILCLFFLLNFLSITTISPSTATTAEIDDELLIISSSNEQFIVDHLFTQRNLFSTLNKSSIDIENEVQLESLLTKNITETYDEFWFITDDFSDYSLVGNLLDHLIESGIPGVIFTSKIFELPSETQVNIGITSCDQNHKDTKQSSFSFDTQNSANFSSLINASLPEIKSFDGNVEYSQCQLDSNAFSILVMEDLEASINDVPVLFLPHYNSSIIVSPIMISQSDDKTNNSTSDSSETESTDTETTDTESTDTETTDTFFLTFEGDQIQINTHFPKKTLKISQTKSLGLLDFLSLASHLNFNDWNTSDTNSFIDQLNAGQGTGNGENILPGNLISKEVLDAIISGSLIIALISFIILVLRKYGIFIIGIVIGFLALFKVPTRKIQLMDVYNNDTRQEMLDILNVTKARGESLRNLSRELSTPIPTLLWHVKILEEFELVIKEKIKRELILISSEYIEEFETYGKRLKEFELTFKSDKSKAVYDYLISLDENNTFSSDDLMNFTDYSSRTIARYVKKLLELQIIQTASNGSRKGKKYKISNTFYHRMQELA